MTASLVGSGGHRLSCDGFFGALYSDIAGKQADAPTGAFGCAANTSTRCMVEIRYAYPTGDLSVVPFDAYF
jgi:hypothetical protein